MIKEDQKNILVVGTGSIGSRHIENLIKFNCNVGAYSYRKENFSKIKNIAYEDTLDSSTIGKYDGVVIANNTDEHLKVSKLCVEQNKPFYVEKPISHNMNEVLGISDKIKNINLFTRVGFMMRAHPNISFLKKYLEKSPKKIFYVSMHVGQWLEDWRPDTDYRKCYSADQEKGGGVILDLIHELDIAFWLFGEIDEVFCFKNKISKLDISTEDYAHILLKSKEGFTVDLNLDYLSSVYKRGMHIIMDGENIEWNYVSGTITLFNKSNPQGLEIEKLDNSFKRNDMFESTMKDFISNLNISNNDLDYCDFYQGAYSQMLATKSHESSDLGRWVKL
jgi:predicted dehydrogenase